MDKKFDAYKTIGEVSKELNIPTHIIRFWETKFERLKSVKRKNNHRYYSKEDIIYILNIKNLTNLKSISEIELSTIVKAPSRVDFLINNCSILSIKSFFSIFILF